MKTYVIEVNERGEAGVTAARLACNADRGETIPNPDYDPGDEASPATIPNPDLFATNEAYLQWAWGDRATESYARQYGVDQ